MIVSGNAANKHYGVAVTGAPEPRDLENCEELGRNVANLVKKLN